MATRFFQDSIVSSGKNRRSLQDPWCISEGSGKEASKIFSRDEATRTLRSETRLLGKQSTPSSYSISFANRSSRSSIEKSISSNSFINQGYSGLVYLMKSYDRNTSFDDSYSDNALASNGPETMFPLYLSIFSDTEDEQQHAKDRSPSLY